MLIVIEKSFLIETQWPSFSHELGTKLVETVFWSSRVTKINSFQRGISRRKPFCLIFFADEAVLTFLDNEIQFPGKLRAECLLWLFQLTVSNFSIDFHNQNILTLRPNHEKQKAPKSANTFDCFSTFSLFSLQNYQLTFFSESRSKYSQKTPVSINAFEPW